jgi:hypothetical protein
MALVFGGLSNAYDLEAVNVNKDIKKLAKEFCTKHGLVFSKFVEQAIKDRLVKIGNVFEEVNSQHD